MAGDFMDEKIIEAKYQEKKTMYTTLETGIYIKDELITFQRINLFNDYMSIILPDSFTTMPAALAEIKYTSGDRPQIIMTSLDTTVNFLFSILPQSLESDQCQEVAKQMKMILARMNPAFCFYDFEETAITKAKLAWFDFKSYALDEDLYNIYYVVPIHEKMMLGMFNCYFKDKKEWKRAAIQVIKSIQDISSRKL